MIDKFIEGVGSKLADRAIVAIFSPAFVFMALGVAAWVYDNGGGAGWMQLEARFQRAGAATLVVLLVGTLLLLITAGFVVQRLTLPVLRLLEGYWPLRLQRLRAKLVEHQTKRYAALEKEFQVLADKREEDATALTPGENDRYVILGEQLALFPGDPARMMPTRLGNVLRSHEDRPREKYGLDAPRVWTQLVLVLPGTTSALVDTARARLDQAVAALIWSALLAVWTIWAWWALVLAVLLSVFVVRWWALEAAERYGEAVVATFDIHRFLLYSALRISPPANPKQEKAAGAALTKFLEAGSDAEQPIFQHPPVKS